MNEWLKKLLEEIGRGEKDDVLLKKYKELGGDAATLKKIRVAGSLMTNEGYDYDRAVKRVLGENFAPAVKGKPPAKTELLSEILAGQPQQQGSGYGFYPTKVRDADPNIDDPVGDKVREQQRLKAADRSKVPGIFEQRGDVTASYKRPMMDAVERQTTQNYTQAKDVFDDFEDAKTHLQKKVDSGKIRLPLKSSGQTMVRPNSVDDYSIEELEQSIKPDNLTDKIALNYYKDARSIDAALKSSRSIEEAAIKRELESGTQLSQQAKKMIQSGNYEKDLPATVRAGLMWQFMNDKTVQQFAERDPQFAGKLQGERLQFMQKYPEYGEAIVAQKIAQGREDKGYNNMFSNIVDKEETDKLVDELGLDAQEKEIYQKRIRPKLGAARSFGRTLGNWIPGVSELVNDEPIRTTGFVENFTRSKADVMHGVGKSLASIPLIPGTNTSIRDIYSSKEDQLASAVDEQLKGHSVDPKGIANKIGMYGGTVTGQVLGMGGVGKGAQAAGIVKSPEAASAIANGLTGYGNYKDEAAMLMPDEPQWKHDIYALGMSGIDGATEHLFPDVKVVDAISDLTRSKIVKTIGQFTDDKLTAVAASKIIGQIVAKDVIKFAGKTVEGNVKESAEEVAGTLGQAFLQSAITGKSVDQEKLGKDVYDTFVTTMLGSSFVSGIAAHYDVQHGKMSRAAIHDIAMNPQRYIAAIEKQAATDDDLAATKDERIRNVNTAAKIADEIKDFDLTDKQSGEYILHGMNQQILEQKLEDTKSDGARKKLEEQISYSKKVQDGILEGKTEQQVMAEEQKKDEKPAATTPVETPPAPPVTYTAKDKTALQQAVKESKGVVQKVYSDAAKVLTTMNEVAPGLSVTVHHDQESYDKAVTDAGGTKKDASGSGGFYFNKDSEQIHINVPQVAKRKVLNEVLHEAAHPLLEMLAEKNPEAINSFHQQITSLAKDLPDVQKAIDFGKNYEKDGDVQVKKEAVVEFLAMVADGDISLKKVPPTVLQRVKNTIENIAKKLGLDFRFNENIDAKDIQKVARQFSDALQKGRKISGKSAIKTKSLQQSKVAKAPGESDSNFDKRQKTLSSLHGQQRLQDTGKRSNQQDAGRTDGSEVGRPDNGRKGTQVGHEATPRYDVGRSNRVVKDESVVKTVSIPDAEASTIREVRPDVMFDKSFSQINSAEQFHAAITASLKGNKYSASVFVYPIEEYKTSKLFLTDDGKAGVAITKDGDIISVFSHGEGKGRVTQLLIHAIRNGGVSLDHYDTRLTDIYYQTGFVPAARVKFNIEFAPKDWDTELYKPYNNGEPDVIAMAYHGGNPATIHERVGRFDEKDDILANTPYVKEWDQAKQLQSEYVAKVKAAPQFSKTKTSPDEKTKADVKASEVTGTKPVQPATKKTDEPATASIGKRREVKEKITDLSKQGLLKSADGKTNMSAEEVDAHMKLMDAMAGVWKDISGKDNFYEEFVNDVHQGDLKKLEQMGGTLFQSGAPDNMSRASLGLLYTPQLVQMQGKMVNAQQIRDFVKNRGKQIEKDIVNDVLNYDKYKDAKKINFDEFRNDVELQVMKLERITTKTYAGYGSDNLGSDNYGNKRTIIFNAPVNHGEHGHFSSDFKAEKSEIGNKVWKLRQIPGTDQWAAVDRDKPADADATNIHQYVGTAGSKEEVIDWIKDRVKRKDKEQINVGLFGHIRMWEDDSDSEIGYLAELQSDFFQKNKAADFFDEPPVPKAVDNNAHQIADKQESAKVAARMERELDLRHEIKENGDIWINHGDDKGLVIRKEEDFTDSYNPLMEDEKLTHNIQQALVDAAGKVAYREQEKYKEVYNNIKVDYKNDVEAEKKKIIDKWLENNKPTVSNNIKQFIASQKIHEVRLLREALKYAAEQGYTKLRFPEGYTIARIEGYVSEGDGDNMMPYEIIRGDYNKLDAGDRIEYGGDEFIVIDAGNTSIKAAPSDQVSAYDRDDLITDETSNRISEIEYEAGKHFNDVDAITKEEVEDYQPDEWMAGKAKKLLEEYFFDNPEAETVGWTEIASELERSVRDNYEDMSADDLVGWAGEVYEDNNTIYAVERRSSIVNFDQPDEYQNEPESSEDDYEENLSSDQKTVVNKYQGLAKEITRLYPDAEWVRDDNYAKWLEIPVTQEHRDNPVIAFQKEGAQVKGAIDFVNDNRATVHIFDGADISTLAHEMGGHLGRRVLDKLSEQDKGFAKDYEVVKKWAGVKNNQWNTRAEEKFARGFETYLKRGIAPTKQLQSVFDKLSQWLSQIYDFIKGNPKLVNVELTPEVTKVFDRLLGGERETQIKPQFSKSVKANIKEATDTRVKDKVIMNELAAIKKQVKDRLRGMNAGFAEGVQETKADQQHLSDVKDAIKDRINELMEDAKNRKVFTGDVKGKLLASVINKLNNVKTPYQLLKFADQLEKILSDVEYDKDLQQAKAIKSKIRKAVSNKKNDRSALTKDVIKDFLRVNPDSTTDIKEYVDTAAKVLSVAEGIKVSANTEGARVKNDEVAISHDDINNYVEVQQTFAQAQAATRLADLHSDLVAAGIIDPATMSLEEMEGIVKAITGDSQPAIDKVAEKMAANENKMKALKSVAEYARIGLEDFNSSSPALTEEEQQIVNDLLKIDLDKLSGVQLAKLIDVMNNITVNENFVGSGEIAVTSKVQQSIIKISDHFKQAGIKLSDLGGRLLKFTKGFASTHLLFEFITKSSKAAAELQRLSGISDIFNGHASAKTLQGKTVDTYNKLKRGMKDIDSAMNRFRRGVYADVMNNFGGTDAEINEEFNRRKIWIRQTADRLLASKEKKEQLEGRIIDQVYNELLDGADKPADVTAHMKVVEPGNIKLVNFWQDAFGDRKALTQENAELYNNQIWEDVENYTATALKGVNGDKGITVNQDRDMFEDAFMSRNLRVAPAGTKTKKVRSYSLPKNSVLNLDFDNVQSKKFYETNYDVETSKGIAQVKQFMASDQATELLGGTKNRNTILNSIKKSVQLQKGRVPVIDEEGKAVSTALNILQAKGVRIALGSVLQFINQYPTIALNTIVNLRSDMGLFIKALGVSNKLPLFDQFGIGLRGQTQAGYSKDVDTGEIERASISGNAKRTYEAAFRLGEKIHDATMKTLVASDVSVARTSWLAFYMQSLKSQGVDLRTVDWNNEHLDPNMEAAAFAEQLVSRNQNPNDPSALGNIFRDTGDGWKNIMRNVVLPFSSFAVNMRMRMTSDMQKILYGSEKKEAAFSLAATVAEQLTFNALKVYLLGVLTTTAANALAKMLGYRDDDDDEDDKEKEKITIKIGEKEIETTRSKKKWFANTFSDLFVGGLGTLTQKGFAEAMNAAYGLVATEEYGNGKLNEFPTLYYVPDQTEANWWDDKGLYAIVPSKVVDTWSNGKLALTGEIDKVVKGGMKPEYEKVELTDEEQKMHMLIFCIDALGLAGVGDAQINQMNSKLKTIAKKHNQKEYGGRKMTITQPAEK